MLITTLAAGLLIAGGCGSQSAHSTAEFDMTAHPTLASSDGLGAHLFAPAEYGVATVAVYRQAESAMILAEAHEADGTYDAWYASFDRGESPDGTTIVDVPVILDDSQH